MSTGEVFKLRKGVTGLPNQTVWDRSLSHMALGVLMQSLATPEGGSLGYRAFMGRGRGAESIRRAMTELEEHGYRWRFRYRVKGQVRTAVIISDVPCTERDARLDAAEIAGTDQLELTSAPLKVENSSNVRKSAKTPSRTVRGKPAHGENEETDHVKPLVAPCAGNQGTVNRGTVFPGAYLSNQGLVKTKPNQTTENGEIEPESVGNGSVGSDWIQIEEQPADLVDAPPTSEELNSDHEPTVSEGVDQSDWEVLLECLPESMHAVAPKMVGRIADRLRERLDGGWSAKRILEILDGNPLPGMVNNLTGLVIHRIGEIPTHAPRAPLPAETTFRAIPVAVEPDLEPLHDGIAHAHEVYKKLLAAGRIPSVARRVPHGTETTGPMSWQKWILLTDQGRTAGQCTPQCPACLCERQDDETPVVAA